MAYRPQSARRFRAIAAVIAALVVGGGLWHWSKTSALRTAEARAGHGAGAQVTRAGAPPVPVSVATPLRTDVPVYATGLGSVQASQTIAVHTQVDGKLDEVRFREGQFVKRGDVLAIIDSRLYAAALDLAKARRAQDVAQLTAAEKDLVRFKTLGARNFQTQQSIDNQQAKVDQLSANIAADDAGIESAKTQLDYTTITAPVDGRVGVRLVDAGNFVRAADAGSIAVLTQTRPSGVLFSLPAQQLEAVRQAMAGGEVEVKAFDQDNQKLLATGKLLLIDAAIDTTTAMMRLKAMFPNEEDKLWPGQFVNARILLETRHDALTIPTAALQRGPDGVFAWIIDDAGKAAVRQLQLGPSSGDGIIVLSGLTGSERVVTNGQYKLRLGAPAAIEAAAAPAPDAVAPGATPGQAPAGTAAGAQSATIGGRS